MEDGTFFAPLWTDFRVTGKTGILDWFTILYGITTAIALTHHGALWLAARSDAEVLTRARHAARLLWPAVALLTVIVTGVTYLVQPSMAQSLKDRPWGLVFVGIAIAGLFGSRIFLNRQQGHRAFIASCAFLYGMMASGACWIFPFVLPGRDSGLGLTVDAAASAAYGLKVALVWWVPGILLVIGYTTYVYRTLPDKFSVHEVAEH